MTEAKNSGTKVLPFALSLGVVVTTVVVLQAYREEIRFYLDPVGSLTLEAGSRSYSEDRSDNVRWLLERGASPNERIPGRRNYAAIHAAAHWGIESSLRLFVEAGADLDQTVVVGGEELTPLDLACKFGGPAAANVLASNGGKRLLSQVVDFEGNPNPNECFD
ncbi:MAG: hypothetical protein WBN07_11300 [Woeseiaceae bacterium]